MVMVSATEMINKAHEGHYAIPAFNTNNLEWTKCILTAAQEMKSPVIIQCSEGAGKYMGGFKVVADLVKDLHDAMGITVPIALHLDHGTYEGAKKCIEVGFTSVMFDGSKYGIEENIEKSKEIIALAHSKGISVECEVGGIGGTEDGVTSSGELADPAECKMVADLGVDFLAAGIGNIHGVYPANWAGLNFERLDEINKAVNGKPLVLHGGSGIPFDQVHKAVTLGVS
ncbi:MAG: ketose-bisphosphate aldolase, partial [Stecheria intestinalis]|nr:ketose-bisphosphate aldolase [Stecheria intestinalis]